MSTPVSQAQLRDFFWKLNWLCDALDEQRRKRERCAAVASDDLRARFAGPSIDFISDHRAYRVSGDRLDAPWGVR